MLAPRGSSRQILAAELAIRHGGHVRAVWHIDSEPSLVPGMGHFLHLTPGFEVRDEHDTPLCTLVDDITIADDLDSDAPPMASWFRLLSDEPRLLRLAAELADPAGGLMSAGARVAAVFGTVAEQIGPMVRVDDRSGATIVIGAPVRGERERPCEIVTPPLGADHAVALDALLSAARDRGFTVPVEAAVHLHVDAAPFRTVPAFSNLVRLFGHWRASLWHALGTNPRCRRLNALPTAILDLVERRWEAWEPLRAAASEVGLTKFFDVNLTKVLSLRPDRHTLEVRILPGSIDAASTAAQAALVEALLLRCQQDIPVPRPTTGSTRELHRLAAGEL